MYSKDEHKEKHDLIEKYKTIQIERLNLSVRAYHGLKRAGINSVSDLLQFPEESLIDIRNLGTKSIEDIKTVIQNLEYVDFGNDPATLYNIASDLTPYYKLLGVHPDQYDHINLIDISLSSRAHNCLKNANIKTMGDLLHQSDFTLSMIKKLGEKSFDEIKTKLLSPDNFKINDFIAKNSASVPYYTLLSVDPLEYQYKHLEGYPLSQRALNSLKKAEIYTLTDLLYQSEEILLRLSGFGKTCLKEIENLFIEQDLIQYLNVENTIDEIHTLDHLNDKYSKIPVFRMKKRLYPFFFVFKSIMNNNWLTMARLERLISQDMIISDLSEIFEASVELRLDQELINFMQWLEFDLNVIINDWFSTYLKNRKVALILQNRARSKTLQECSNLFGITRERVRQIEAKLRQKFQAFNKNTPIIMMVHAIRDGDEIITPVEIDSEINCFTDELLYLLKKINSENYIYDKNLDVFIIGPDMIRNKAQQFVDSLPDIIKPEKMKILVDSAVNEDGLSEELVYKVIDDQFTLTGEVYHRSRLTLSSVYENVLRKYYSFGIRVYSNNAMNSFREYILKEYGEIDLPKENRAISVRIADLGVLCNRGTYISGFFIDINNKLMEQIKNFIDSYEEENIFYNDIFDHFRDELILTSNITNKYFLHGILKKKYSDNYEFKKDYLIHKYDVSTKDQYILPPEYFLAKRIEDFFRNSLDKVTIDSLLEGLPELSGLKRVYLLNFLRMSEWSEEVAEDIFVYNHVNVIESLDQVNIFFNRRDKACVYKAFRSISQDVFEMAMDSDYELKELLWESKYNEFVELCLGNGITKAGALLFVPYRNEQLVNILYYKKLSEIINLVQDWLENLSFTNEEDSRSTDAILNYFWRQ